MIPRILKYLLPIVIGLILTLLSTSIPITGSELFGKITCGDPFGLPFAFTGGFRHSAGDLVPLCIEAVHGLPLIIDFVFWIVLVALVMRQLSLVGIKNEIKHW